MGNSLHVFFPPQAYLTYEQYSEIVVRPRLVIRHENYLIRECQEVVVEVQGRQCDHIALVKGCKGSSSGSVASTTS